MFTTVSTRPEFLASSRWEETSLPLPSAVARRFERDVGGSQSEAPGSAPCAKARYCGALLPISLRGAHRRLANSLIGWSRKQGYRPRPPFAGQRHSYGCDVRYSTLRPSLSGKESHECACGTRLD